MPSDAADDARPAPSFSVIVPTYQRRDIVCDAVASFARLDSEPDFELIVVVDGSTDGTAAALGTLDCPFPLRIVEQDNAGASAARNAGAARAAAEYLLFLDDDMFPEPGILGSHLRALRAGADIVIGHLPLHPDSPPGLLRRGVERWGRERLTSLSECRDRLPFDEIVTGQMSIRRERFAALGGFDTAFTADGSFGNEDIEFGIRVTEQGLRTVFESDAVSWQKYVVTPARYLEQYRGCGRADVLLEHRHPTLCRNLASRRGFYRERPRAVVAMYRLLQGPLRTLGLRYVALELPRHVAMFFRLVNLEYHLGVREGERLLASGGAVRRPLSGCTDLPAGPDR